MIKIEITCDTAEQARSEMIRLLNVQLLNLPATFSSGISVEGGGAGGQPLPPDSPKMTPGETVTVAIGEGEKPKRFRRTKAEMEAAAAVVEKQEEPELPLAVQSGGPIAPEPEAPEQAGPLPTPQEANNTLEDVRAAGSKIVEKFGVPEFSRILLKFEDEKGRPVLKASTLKTIDYTNVIKECEALLGQ